MSDPYTGPRPMATYDPTPDGHAPVPLNGTIAALQHLSAAIEDARAALAGCTTPLNLARTDEDLKSMAVTANEALDHILRAADHIEHDDPLASAFPGEAPWWEIRKTAVLSPRQILTLADRADDVMPSQHVTYREVIAAVDNAVPTIILQGRAHVAAAQRRDEREQLKERILEDIENQPCPMCGAVPGSYCRTKSGRVGGPHAGRKKASPLAREYPEVARTVQRDDVETAELFLEERRERAEERQRLLGDRVLVGEVVEELAEQLSLKDDR